MDSRFFKPIVVLSTGILSIAIYYLFYASMVAFAVRYLNKSSHVNVSVGIALHYYFYYFCFLSFVISGIYIYGMHQRWSMVTLLAVFFLVVPPVIYWFWALTHIPYWSMLVIVSTLLGIVIPLLVVKKLTGSKGINRGRMKSR